MGTIWRKTTITTAKTLYMNANLPLFSEIYVHCTTTNVDDLCHFNSGLFYFTENKFCIILQPQTQK